MTLAHSFLGLLEKDPRHGYELKQMYDERFGISQSVKYGQVYTTLARLRRDGLIDLSTVEAGGGPDRKLYVITLDGVTELERWLLEPDPPATFGRNVLFSKVVVSLMSGRPAGEVLDIQRAAHLDRMRELTSLRNGADTAGAMAYDFELFHLEADLRWIETAGDRVVRSSAARRRGEIK